MIKFENSEVLGWEHAIRGMRNPMNSWNKSDSYPCLVVEELTKDNYKSRCAGCKNEFVGRPNCVVIGDSDYSLMMRLRNAGTDHRKYMRMIAVYVDITAPLYWWKEFDTYKVGTVANSCSTMHKIHEKEFTLEDFSHEHLFYIDDPGGKFQYNVPIPNPENRNDREVTGECVLASMELLTLTISVLNTYRTRFLRTGKKYYWHQMIQLLPSSYNQRRTVMLNYEVLANIYKSRKNHKLDEWREFCTWIESLPYSEIITGSRE